MTVLGAVIQRHSTYLDDTLCVFCPIPVSEVSDENMGVVLLRIDRGCSVLHYEIWKIGEVIQNKFVLLIKRRGQDMSQSGEACHHAPPAPNCCAL